MILTEVEKFKLLGNLREMDRALIAASNAIHHKNATGYLENARIYRRVYRTHIKDTGDSESLEALEYLSWANADAPFTNSDILTDAINSSGITRQKLIEEVRGVVRRTCEQISGNP